MKAIMVEPKKPGTAQFEDMLESDVNDGSVLVEAVAVGVCGTDDVAERALAVAGDCSGAGLHDLVAVNNVVADDVAQAIDDDDVGIGFVGHSPLAEAESP